MGKRLSDKIIVLLGVILFSVGSFAGVSADCISLVDSIYKKMNIEAKFKFEGNTFALRLLDGGAISYKGKDNKLVILNEVSSLTLDTNEALAAEPYLGSLTYTEIAKQLHAEYNHEFRLGKKFIPKSFDSIIAARIESVCNKLYTQASHIRGTSSPKSIPAK